MSENIYVYEKEKPVIGFPAPSMEEFMKEPTKYYPDIQPGFIASNEKIENYIIESGIVRKKTREEEILLDDKYGLLLPGEYVENDKIMVVSKPEESLKPIWNTETNSWEESATKEDIDKEVKNLISEYVFMSEKKEKYEKYGFSTLDIEEEMALNIMRRIELLALKETLI